MGLHNRSTTSGRIASRVALAGGMAAVAGAVTLAGAGTASAASFHLFGHHGQRHAEHHLGISGSPGNTQTSSTDAHTTASNSHATGAKTSAAHRAKTSVSAEHHVGKTGSTAH